MLLLLIELKMAKFYLLNSLRRNVKSYFVLQPIFSVSILPHALKLQLHFFVPFNLDSPCYSPTANSSNGSPTTCSPPTPTTNSKHTPGRQRPPTHKKKEKDTPPPWLQPAGHSRGGAFFVLIQLPKKPPHRSLLQTDGEAHIHSDHSLSQSMPTYRRARAGPLPPPP